MGFPFCLSILASRTWLQLLWIRQWWQAHFCFWQQRQCKGPVLFSFPIKAIQITPSKSLLAKNIPLHRYSVISFCSQSSLNLLFCLYLSVFAPRDLLPHVLDILVVSTSINLGQFYIFLYNQAISSAIRVFCLMISQLSRQTDAL